MPNKDHKVTVICSFGLPCTFRSNTGDQRCLKEEAVFIGSDGTCSVVAMIEGRLDLNVVRLLCLPLKCIS